MGNKLFGQNISGLIKKHIGPGVLAAKLIKEVPGARDSADLAAGQALKPVPYACRGFIDEYTSDELKGTNIQRGDKKILLVGDTLPKGIIPERNDRIQIEGRVYVIEGVSSRDPAAATYICQARG